MTRPNIAVFSFNSVNKDTSLANTRTARFLAEELGAPLFGDDPAIQHQTNLDVLFLVAGVFLYSRSLADTAPAIRTAKRVVWVENDYTVIPPKAVGTAESPFRYAFRERHAAGLPHLDFWTTVEHNANASELSSYINWNSLAYEGISDEEFANNRTKMKNAVLYFGADRAGRRQYFDRYFLGQKAPLVLSSFGKGMASRYHNDADILPAQTNGALRELIADHSMGLYLEDKKSHTVFTSPATRFYEMLSVGQAMVFQPEAIPMLDKAGYNVRPYAVTPNGLHGALCVADDIARAQRQAWASIPHRNLLKTALANAWTKLLGGM